MNGLHDFRGGGGVLHSHTKPVVGVLALQGAYDAHAKALTSLGADIRLIRRPDQLHDLDGLILPGGESTTFLRHLERDGFFAVLYQFVRQTPTFGTCAGVILLAKEVHNPAQASLGALDITVERNAYGRQLDSTILITPTELPGGPLEMVFIRAPRITRTGPDVETLATRASHSDDQRAPSPILIRQGHLLAATFHPELSADTRIHQLFLAMIAEHHDAALTPAAAVESL